MNGPQPMPGFQLLAPPWWGQPQQLQTQQAQVPPRVRVAMEFLERLTSKTATIAMPTYSSERVEFTPIDGQRLTDEESVAQASACNLLSAYFAGKLPECQWDGFGVDNGLAKLKIKCPKCDGGCVVRGKLCPVCRGRGEVLTCALPAEPQGEGGE